MKTQGATEPQIPLSPSSFLQTRCIQSSAEFCVSFLDCLCVFHLPTLCTSCTSAHRMHKYSAYQNSKPNGAKRIILLNYELVFQVSMITTSCTFIYSVSSFMESFCGIKQSLNQSKHNFIIVTKQYSELQNSIKSISKICYTIDEIFQIII